MLEDDPTEYELSDAEYKRRMDEIQKTLDGRRQRVRQIIDSMADCFRDMLPKGSVVSVQETSELDRWYVSCIYQFPENPQRTMVVEYKEGEGFSTCKFPR